jgi:hypothetical protein
VLCLPLSHPLSHYAVNVFLLTLWRPRIPFYISVYTMPCTL